MGSGPASTTKFHAFGQGLYFVKPTGTYRGGDVLLFAISEETHKWLGWYYITTGDAIDSIIRFSGRDGGTGEGADFDMIAEGNALHGTFVTHKPITVEELCGPILASRKPLRSTGDGLRKCLLAYGNSNKTYVAVTLTIEDIVDSSFTTFHLRLRASDVAPPPSGTRRIGFVQFEMSELFQYPSKHINDAKRLKSMRRQILQQPKS